MKTRFFILIIFLAITIASCSKKDESETLPHQTVAFVVGPDFQITMPGVLPATLRTIAFNGTFSTANQGISEYAILLNHHGSDYYDTLFLQPVFSIDNLDSDYFRFLDGKNTLQGKIIMRDSLKWRNCCAEEISLQGNLSFIYQQN